MNCDKEAAAMLTFAPPDAKAWLYDLEDPDPTGGIILCRKHANATVVPMSWQLVDARDPAWPGRSSAQPDGAPDTVVEVEASTVETSMVESMIDEAMAPALPSDAVAIDAEFAALQADLPVTPRRYAEPMAATTRSAGPPSGTDLLVNAGVVPAGPDPSLFELPISDIPAVTPHPGY